MNDFGASNFLDDWELRKKRELEAQWERFGAPVLDAQYTQPMQGGTVEAYAQPNPGELPTPPEQYSASWDSLARPEVPQPAYQPPAQVNAPYTDPNTGLTFGAPTAPSFLAGQVPLTQQDIITAPPPPEPTRLQRIASALPSGSLYGVGMPDAPRGQGVDITTALSGPEIPWVRENVQQPAGRLVSSVLRGGYPALFMGAPQPAATPERLQRVSDLGQFLGESAIPTRPLDIALTAAPFASPVARGLGRIAAFPGRLFPAGESLGEVPHVIPNPGLSAAERAARLRGTQTADPLEVLRQKLEAPTTRQPRAVQTSAQAARLRAAQAQASSEGLSGQALIDRVKELGATSDPLLQGTGGLGLTQEQKNYIIDHALALGESDVLSPQDIQFNIPRFLNQAEDLTAAQRNLLRRVVTGEGTRTSGAAASASLEGVIPAQPSTSPGVVSTGIKSFVETANTGKPKTIADIRAFAERKGIDLTGIRGRQNMLDQLSAADAERKAMPQGGIPPVVSTGGSGAGTPPPTRTGGTGGEPPVGPIPPALSPEPLPGNRESLSALTATRGMQPSLTPQDFTPPLPPREPIWAGDPTPQPLLGWEPYAGPVHEVPPLVQGPQPRPNLAEGYLPEKTWGATQPALERVPGRLPAIERTPLVGPNPVEPHAPFSISGLPAAANHNIDAMAQGSIEAVRNVKPAGIGTRVTAPLAGEFSDPVVNEIFHRERELRDAITRFGDVTIDQGIDPLTGARLTDRPLAAVVKSTPQGREVMRLELESKRLGEQFREAALQARYGSDTRAMNRARDVLKAADAEHVASGVASHWYDAIQGSMRELMLNFDILGVAGQQGLRAARGSTSIGTGLIGRVARAAGHAPDIYLRGDIDQIAQMMIDGVQMGRGGSTADIAKEGLSRVPVLGDILDSVAAFQFEHILGTVRKLAYEGLLMQNKALGIDITNPVVRQRIGEMANTLGSTARPAATPRRAAIEARSMLSSRMTRAQLNETALIPKTLRSPTDAINTANWVASTAALAAAGYYLNKAVGLDDTEMNMVDWVAKHMNPADTQNFARFATKQRNAQGEPTIIDFMPQTQVARAGVRAIDKLLQNDPQGAAFQLGKLSAGRAGPLPAAGGRFAGYGYDSKGQIHLGESNRMSTGEAAWASIPQPISVSSYLNGGADPVSIALSQSGVTAYGETGKAAIDRARDQQSLAIYGKKFDELTDMREVNEINRTPEVKVLADKELQRQAAAGSRIAENKLTDAQAVQDARYGQGGVISLEAQLHSGEITGEEFRVATDQILQTLAIDSRSRYKSDAVQEELRNIPAKDRTPLMQAREDYFNQVVEPSLVGQDQLDFDRYAENLARWEESHPGFTKEQVSPARALSPEHEQLLKDRVALKPYREAERTAWSEVQKSVPAMREFNSVGDAFSGAKAHYVGQGFPNDIAEAMASGFVSDYSDFLSQQRERFLTSSEKNFDLINILDRWGYNVPADLQLYVTPRR